MADDDEVTAPTALPEQLQEITEQDFLDWRHHPVTRVYRRFLSDYRDALRRDHNQRWELNPVVDVALSAAHEAEARGRVLTLGEMFDLQHAHVVSFYQSEEEKANDDHDANVDD